MQTYILLLRGINVGGNNKVPMSALKQHLQELGYSDVATYIASGNVIIKSHKHPKQIRIEIEAMLPHKFKIDTELIKVLVLTRAQLESVVAHKPKNFGDEPGKYHSDVIFLIDQQAEHVMPVFSPKEGVDTIWPGDGVIYSQRLSAQRTKSRLNKVMSSPFYKHMTIRNWNTVTKLVGMASV